VPILFLLITLADKIGATICLARQLPASGQASHFYRTENTGVRPPLNLAGSF